LTAARIGGFESDSRDGGTVIEPFLEIRLQDVIDILLVTTLVYTTIVLVRRTQAGFVAIGILILGGLYSAASALDLRLTAWIFQGFFAVFLVIIVVIFQEELRQLFERIAVWGLRRRSTSRTSSDAADVLIACVADFARDRIGALIVLPGEQPLDRHMQGGIALNGAISLPLLKSLFDPHSPGHDGAVVVERDRIERFAAHLPLSKDFTQLAGMGTRHAAALGLAERSDALCIVVSEERGQIAVARNGRLRVLTNPQELGAILQEFARTQQRTRGARFWPQLLRENWVEKLASLALVLTLWYLYVPGSRPTVFTYDIPVKVINVPRGYETEEINPPLVTVSFVGTRRAFYLFDPKNLEITVDAAQVKPGRHVFALSDQNVRYPKELTLERLRPSKVRVELKKKAGAASAAPPA
jgi:uncharacterized protein (TIGR00159 family)